MDYNFKQLLGDVVLVEQLEQSGVSEGGIHIPQTADHTKIGIRAKVLMIGSKFRYAKEFNEAMGSDKREYTDPLIVIVSKYLGTSVDRMNDRIRVYDGEDILGIVKEG